MILKEIFNINKPDNIQWKSHGSIEVGEFSIDNENYQILLRYLNFNNISGVLTSFSHNYNMDQNLTNKNQNWIQAAKIIKTVALGSVKKIIENNVDFVLFGAAKESINDAPEKRLKVYSFIASQISRSSNFKFNYTIYLIIGNFKIISRKEFSKEELNNVTNYLNHKSKLSGF